MVITQLSNRLYRGNLFGEKLGEYRDTHLAIPEDEKVSLEVVAVSCLFLHGPMSSTAQGQMWIRGGRSDLV